MDARIKSGHDRGVEAVTLPERSWKAKGARQPFVSRTTKPETADF
jgi:hypothetical protein